VASAQDRVLAYLRQHQEGADDDDLAAAMGWSYRQRANQVCKAMAQKGVVERKVVDGKIRSFALDAPGLPTSEGSAVPISAYLSFTDAAEYVLENQVQRRLLHYRDITERALAAGVLTSTGRTPEATMYSQIHAEVQRQTKRGEVPRFTKPEAGFIGLTRWLPRGVVREIEAQNQRVRTKLHQRLLSLDPIEFEALVARLLSALGFEEVELTPAKGDGGIDVRGTLVVGEVIRTRMAVQVKRWKHNVHTPVIQQVRGSLGAHEQGLIITTSGFSAGARSEAERADATPVALMDGSQLVSVLIENDIGVRRDSYDLIKLEEESDDTQCPD